ncbi:phosphotransferase family protein [Pseudonocardia sp. NPDC049154]|uniref:phosphotransferase family protein n=1 Tax=Pseudonocardia sp. NPDC049154 TaxID=3155501 RepID=UPI0033E53C5D
MTTLPVGRLGPWLRGRLGFEPPFTAELVAGGRSNLTYRVTDGAGRRVAVRRPPAKVEVAGAHDMAREHRILSALHGSAVHVPAPLALCEDPDPIGAPFLVTEFVDGGVLRDTAAAATLDPRARRSLGFALVDQLVALHRTDPAAVGLDDLGRPEGYLARQLRRWSGVITGAEKTSELLREGHRALRAGLPASLTALLHGDFRLDNVIVTATGEIRAVLDWELSTRGDPLTDLGWLLLYWQPGPELGFLPGGSELEGFPTAAELAERYAAGTGADLGRLDYYRGFAAWRLAAITLGVRDRYRSGAGAGSTVDVDRLDTEAELLAAAALNHL